jgi:hypothetical protein
MNPNLPLGLGICKTCNLLIPSGEKKYSLSGVFWGGLYENTGGKNDLVAFRDEKKYRLGRAGSGASSWGLRRLAVFAGEPGGEPGTPKSYFEVFEKLYPWPGH